MRTPKSFTEALDGTIWSQRLVYTHDSQGRRLRLPADLAVCECHQCHRLAVRARLSRSHASYVNPLLARGHLGRLKKQPPGARPICRECHHILAVLEGAA